MTIIEPCDYDILIKIPAKKLRATYRAVTGNTIGANTPKQVLVDGIWEVWKVQYPHLKGPGELAKELKHPQSYKELINLKAKEMRPLYKHFGISLTPDLTKGQMVAVLTDKYGFEIPLVIERDLPEVPAIAYEVLIKTPKPPLQKDWKAFIGEGWEQLHVSELRTRVWSIIKKAHPELAGAIDTEAYRASGGMDLVDYVVGLIHDGTTYEEAIEFWLQTVKETNAWWFRRPARDLKKAIMDTFGVDVRKYEAWGEVSNAVTTQNKKEAATREANVLPHEATGGEIVYTLSLTRYRALETHLEGSDGPFAKALLVMMRTGRRPAELFTDLYFEPCDSREIYARQVAKSGLITKDRKLYNPGADAGSLNNLLVKVRKCHSYPTPAAFDNSLVRKQFGAYTTRMFKEFVSDDQYITPKSVRSIHANIICRGYAEEFGWARASRAWDQIFQRALGDSADAAGFYKRVEWLD